MGWKEVKTIKVDLDMEVAIQGQIVQTDTENIAGKVD